MKSKDAFSTYHPVVTFLYFAVVIACSMFLMHPACLLISAVSAIAYSLYLSGAKARRFLLRFLLPLLVITALLNPAFNHAGVTILRYLPNGNPITLESILYGAAAAVLLIAVISWFSCFNAVITTDKLVYLFGRVTPALSLILSMTLRFVPRFRAQMKTVSEAQRCIGRDGSGGRLLQRMKNGVRILSVMITWALESAIMTADSMKARGYGLPGRTAFSIFCFDRRDRSALGALLVLSVPVIAGAAAGATHTSYFPAFSVPPASPVAVSALSAYLALCLMPLIINVWEDLRWKHIESVT